MRAVKALGIIVVGVALTLLVTGIFLPTHFRVARAVQIDAQIRVVWPLVADLHQQATWSPWKAHDPTMTFAFPGETTGVDATCTWTSDRSGQGSMTITREDVRRRLDTKVVFDGASEAVGSITLEPSGEGAWVTWAFEGDDTTPVVGPWVALLMEGRIGPDLEAGLARLADLAVEAARSAPPAEPISRAPASPTVSPAAQATAAPEAAAATPPVQ